MFINNFKVLLTRDILSIKFKFNVFSQVTDASQISDIKKSISKVKSALYPDRQSIRLEARGKTLKDTDRVKDLG